MKVCKMAFCGAGKWTQTHHVPTLEQRANQFQIKGFFDVSEKTAIQAAGESYHVYPSYDHLLDDTEVDFVVITTKPTSTHFVNAERALKRGKNVLLEKPMACSSRECDKLIQLAKEKKVLFTVYQSRRYDLDYRVALEMMKEQLGDVRYVLNNSPRSWYENEDFSNFGIHLLDQALAMNRSPLKEINAFFLHPDKNYDECGYGEATLRFEKPPIIRISLMPNPTHQDCDNGIPAPRWNRFYIAGTKGSFTLTPISVFNRDSGKNGIAALTPATSLHELDSNNCFYFDNCLPDFTRPEFREDIKYSFYDSLYKSWYEGTPLDVTPEQSRNAIRCLELMLESARLNSSVKVSGLLTN